MGKKTGIFITIEGIDGSGKSTLQKNLIPLLACDGIEPVITKEPGGTPLGQKIKNILENTELLPCPQSEFLLFAAARAQHFLTVIIPALAEEKMVISDRMADSSLAYQGYGRGVNIAMIKTINDWVTQNYKPDLIFYVRIDGQTALERIRGSRDLNVFEQNYQKFIENVIRGFDTIFKDKPHVITLDGTFQPNALAEQAYYHIKAWIKQRIMS